MSIQPSTESWRFESDRLDAIRRKMTAGRKTLAEIYGLPLYGIKTGLNDAFVLSRKTRDALIARDARSSDLLKPYLVGENLKRWYADSDDLWLVYTPKNRVDIEEYPAIRDHLIQHRVELEGRATKQKWWELQQSQAAYEVAFRRSKIIYCDISNNNTASIDRRGYYPANTCYFVGSDDPQLAAVLNSKAFWFLVSGVSNIAQNGYIRLRSEFVGQTPIPSTVDGSFEELTAAVGAAADERKEHIEAFLARASDLRGATLAPSLISWHEQTFAEFRSAIKRLHRVEIPVAQRDEWERYFNARKEEIALLSRRIADAESEINDRIYRLFDLSRDEIALIEESMESPH